jgi:5-methylcytosine-specific restriction endonuclease McrA
MDIPALESVPDSELHSRLKTLRDAENVAVANIVLHLSEVDKRGSYRELGYSNSFTYCREYLGYSDGAAGRRVRAARVVAGSSEVYQLLREGRVSLCALSEVAAVINAENRSEVLSLTEGCSKREAQRVAVQFGEPEKPRRERVRAKRVAVEPTAQGDLYSGHSSTSPVERFSVYLEVSPEFMAMVDEVKNLTGATNVTDALGKCLKGYLREKTKAPVRRARATKPESRVLKPSRYVPRSVRHEVRKRDGGQCSFVSAQGKRCSCRHGLQLDHVYPHALGGASSVENLRLLCPAHNQLHAEKCFGREFIEERRHRR